MGGIAWVASGLNISIKFITVRSTKKADGSPPKTRTCPLSSDPNHSRYILDPGLSATIHLGFL